MSDERELTLADMENAQHLLLQTDLHTDTPKAYILSRAARKLFFGMYELPSHTLVRRTLSYAEIDDLLDHRGATLDVLLNFPPPTDLELLEAAVGDADAFLFRDHMGQAHAARRRTVYAARHLFRVIGVSGQVGLESILEMFQPDIGSIVVLPKQVIPW